MYYSCIKNIPYGKCPPFFCILYKSQPTHDYDSYVPYTPSQVLGAGQIQFVLEVRSSVKPGGGNDGCLCSSQLYQSIN